MRHRSIGTIPSHHQIRGRPTEPQALWASTQAEPQSCCRASRVVQVNPHGAAQVDLAAQPGWIPAPISQTSLFMAAALLVLTTQPSNILTTPIKTQTERGDLQTKSPSHTERSPYNKAGFLKSVYLVFWGGEILYL